MDKSPVWDFYKSPKIQLTKSQLDKLAHDNGYAEIFIDWMNGILREASTAGTTVELGEVQFPQPNFQSQSDNILSRIIGVSTYDQIAKFLSSAHTNYVVQIYDKDTVLRIEYLQDYVMPLMITILNGNFETFQMEKRLWEANEQLKQEELKVDEPVVFKRIRELLRHVRNADIHDEIVNVAKWLESYNSLGAGAQIPRKASAIIDNFDLRLWRREKVAKLVKLIESELVKESFDSPFISKQIDVLKSDLATKSLESFADQNINNEKHVFECDTTFPLTLNCASDVAKDTTQILQDVDTIQKQFPKSKCKDLLYQRIRKLEDIADGQIVVYENLLQLFESSKDTTFAQQLKEEHIPKLESLSTSSSLVHSWQDVMKMLSLIRLKLDGVDPSATKLKETNSTNTLEYIRLTIRKTEELEKRCCFNKLSAIFATIESAFGATFLGQSFQDKLCKIYMNNWKLLQDVVSKNKINNKVFGENFISALQDLVEVIQSTTEVLHNKLNPNSEPVDKLQYLTEGWTTISNAILAYLEILKNDRWTLPLLLDNHIFQIQKAHSLLPSPSNDASDTLSKLSFKIYAMQISFERFLKSAVTLQKNLALIQPSNPERNSLTNATQMLIDEIEYRERSISVPFKTHASYAAAHDVLCETIVRHLSWYFCAGSTSDREERYFIDFTMFDSSGDTKITMFDRLPDVSGYVSYMKQFINDSNRSRKTATFKMDFFKMMYVQILSNFHSIQAGNDVGSDIEFMTDLFDIPPIVKTAATSLIRAQNTPEAIFKLVRMSSAWKQLTSQYEYDKLVETWSVDALTQTDFNQLMDHAKAFFDVVQQYYSSIFKTKDDKFLHTSVSSLCHNLSISSLVNVLKPIVPNWYTEEMCTKIVWNMLWDESARASRSRGLRKDIKLFFQKVRKAGGVRDEMLDRKYICSSLERIQTWGEESGLMQAEYSKHLDLMLEKCRLSSPRLINAVFGSKDEWHQLSTVIRDDLINAIINNGGSSNFLSILIRLLENDYDVEHNYVKRYLEDKNLKRNSAALESTFLCQSILSATRN